MRTNRSPRKFYLLASCRAALRTSSGTAMMLWAQYHFHGSVMKIAEPGFEVECAATCKFAAQLFFVLLIDVKNRFECKLRLHC